MSMCDQTIFKNENKEEGKKSIIEASLVDTDNFERSDILDEYQ